MAEPPPAHAYPFFKYNIIFFYISQVAALTSPLFWYRTDCSGPRFGASEASIKNVGWMAIWCLEDDVPRFQPAWAKRILAPIGIYDHALSNGPTAVSGVRAFLASLDNSGELASLRTQTFQASVRTFLANLRAISGLECTHKGHMDSTEKLPYVVPRGNSGRHARARPAKTLQEY